MSKSGVGWDAFATPFSFRQYYLMDSVLPSNTTQDKNKNISSRLPARLLSLSDLLVEQLLSIGPHPRFVPLRKLQETRQQIVGELFRGLPRKKRGEVVDGDDGERRRARGQTGDVDGGSVKGRVDRVDGDGVVRVRGVARDVDDDG
jgi:hypothetical protein